MKRVLAVSVFVFVFAASACAQSSQANAKSLAKSAIPAPAASAAAAQTAARASFARLPLSFEENLGQTDARVKYTSRGGGYSLFLTQDEAVLALGSGSLNSNCAGPARKLHPECADPSNNRHEGAALWLKFLGANPSAQIDASDVQPGKINYYVGNDPSRWRTGVRQFGRVIYRGIYPGVDLTYYGNQQQLESDFVVAAGTNPRSVEFEIDGAKDMRLDPQGNLVLATAVGEVHLLRPGVYQVVEGQRRDLPGRYVLRGKNRIGFEVGAYDNRNALVIDPVLTYSTYLGGSSGDTGNAVTIDAAGDAFVTGLGESFDFPGAASPSQSPDPVSQFSFGNFAFVTKFDPTGNTLLYSTLLRGTANSGIGTSGNGIGLDSSGNAYVAGVTSDSDFPLLNPFQATLGDDPVQSNSGFMQSGFVAGLDSSGALIYSTFLGGRNDGDQNTLTGLAADASGNAYVTGYTNSQNFPTLVPFQAVNNSTFGNNAVVAKFTNQGQLVYSTYLGGNSEDQGNAIAVDSSGNAYVTGSTSSANFPVQSAPAPFQATQNTSSQDAFVSKINFNSGTQTLTLVNSTYLGGDSTDTAFGIAVDTASPANVYLTGQTASTGASSPFPTQNPIFAAHSGATEAFVTKLNGTFTALVYSTFLGGTGSANGGDEGLAIALDGANPPDVFVTGDTNSADFPLFAPLQSAIGSSTASDAFVTEINGTGSAVTYSTYLGGLLADKGLGIAADSAGNAYLTGSTKSANFPVLSSSGAASLPFQDQLNASAGNAFLTKISPAAAVSNLNFFPPVFTYPATGINDTGLVETFTLNNNSGSSVTINAPSLSGTNAGDFIIIGGSTTCNNALVMTAGSSCVIAVRFVPQDQDARSATLGVTSTSSASASVNLSGFGAVPEISLSPATINYGTNMALNITSSGFVSITNTGGGTLKVGSVQITNAGSDAAAFTIASNSCSSVAAHGSCFVQVNLTPTTAKAYSATLLINSNAAGSPTTMAISGTAVAQVNVFPTSLEYGGQLLNTATRDNEITVQNGSGGVITLSSITAGGSSGDFPVDTSAPSTFVPTCVAGLQLQPGVSCSFYVFFQPTKGTAFDGDTATYTFNWTGALSGSKLVTVMGTGETGVVLYQTNYTAPSEYVGASERQAGFDEIFNGTNSPIQITSIVLSGAAPQDYKVELENSCSVNGTIPANSTCFLDGEFSPSATGTRSVTATINYTPPSGSSLTLNATGIGLAGPVSFPGSHDFGTQIVGLQGTVQRIVLENLQKIPLQITTVSAVTGTNAADFVVQGTSTCKSSTTVQGAGKCFLDIQFKPGAAGSRSASLTITDNGPGSPRTLNMSGTGEAPTVTVTPSTLDFGNVALINPPGSQPTVTAAIYLTNSGNSATTISIAPALTTGGTPFAIAAGAGTTCVASAAVLPQGGTCSIAVTFKPTGTGQVTNSLTLTDSVGGLHTVQIQGTGVNEGVLSATSSLAFNQAPSSTSSAQTVTVTNTGTGPLTLTAVALNGTNPSNFAIVSGAGTTCTPGTSIPAAPGPGNTCTIAVTFTAPSTAGSFSANLLVTANLGNNASGSSSTRLTGSSLGLSISPSTTPYDFGTVPEGTAVNFSTITNSVFGVTVTNNFASAITITGVAPQTAGDFTVTNSNCSGSLSVGSFCFFDITFTPSVTTAENNNILISYTGGSNSPFSIPVKGTGSAALLAAPNPVNVTAAVGSSAFPTVTIGNGTSSPVTINSVNPITGTNASDFTLGFSFCTFTPLAPAGTAGSSCTVSVTFTPASPGAKTAQFTVTYNTSQTLTINLSGTATAAQVSLFPSPLNFGNQVSNTQSLVLNVVVTNTGNSALNVTGLAITGTNANDFALAPESSPFGGIGTPSNVGCQNEFSGLAPGASCTIPITFTPTLQYTGASRSAVLNITDNAYPSTKQTVVLEGNAPAGTVAASPSSLSFPNTNVGSSTTETVLVSNTTGSAVTFTNSPNFVTFGTTSYSVDATQTLNACAQSTKLSAFTGSCTLYIKFAPGSASAIPDTATIHTSSNSPTVTLSGTGTSAVVNVSPTSLVFGNQNVGTTSASQTLTLNNPTGSAVTVSAAAPTFTGTNPTDFQVATNNCLGKTVAANSSCTITVTFTPGTSGGTSRTATVTISDSSPAASFPVTLSGTAVQPVASLNSTTMAFGSSNVGVTTGQQTVTLTNTGNAALNLSNIVLGGTNAADFSIVVPSSGTQCTSTTSLAASASCVIAATFDPKATGSRTATITVTDNATPATQVITLSGTGATPGVSFNPTSITFGNQFIKTTSAQSTTVLTNSGTGPLTISAGSVTIAGTNASDFTLVTPSGVGVVNCVSASAVVVAPGASCTIAVTFTPSATGARSASVSVSDDASGSPQSVPLSGTGTAPAVTLNPTTTVSFGNEILSVTSGQQTVTLTNSGTASLTLATVALGGTNVGDFTIVSGPGTTCVNAAVISSVAPNNTCTVVLAFTPSATGARSATLTFTDNAGGTAGTAQTLTLSGTGQTAPTATLSTGSVTFGSQEVGTSSAATTVTVTNNGDATLTITALALDASGNPGDFVLTAGATTPCSVAGSTTVAGHTSCTFNVAFKPTATGARTGTVDLTDNGNATGTAGTKQTVGLSGTGTAPVAQVASTLPFGNQPINQTATLGVTLTNNGTAPLVLAGTSAVAITGTNANLFGIANTTTCTNGLTIAVNGTCTINVTFAPTAVGSFGPATLTITDDSGAVAGSKQTVTLTGAGVAASVNFSPSPVNFTPNQNVGTTSANTTVTLTNSGGLAVHLAASNAVAISGANAGDFSVVGVETTCINGATVGVSGGSCVVILTFTPSATGARTATLTITDDANPTTQTVTLNGTGVAPVASAPTSLSFGNEINGVTSTQQTITLTNTGTASLTLATVALGGANAGDFAIVSGPGTTCVGSATIGFTAPNNTCTVVVTFTPGAAGARSATLTFTDNSNEVSGSTQTVTLSGTGQTAPTATLSTGSVTFGTQEVGTSSAATTVTVTNNGDATLTITALALDASGNPGDFVLTAGATTPCSVAGSTTVAGHTSCTFNVAFKPTATGARTGTVDLTDNGNATGTAGTKQTVGLSGTGTAPVAQVASTLPFGNQPINQTATLGVTLTNNGTAPLVLAGTSAVAITGTNANLFGIANTTTCTNGLTIAVNGTCTINVTFAPTAVGSFGPATLTITDDSGAVAGTKQTVTLSGSGVTSTVNFNPNPLSFGSQRVGTTSGQMTSVLTNSAATSLTITGVTFTGTNPADFAFATPASGTDCRTTGTVAVGATCTIAVTFAPSATGPRSATVSVADNAVGSPHTLTLSGTGTAPAASLSSNSVTFANQIQTTTSAAQTITVTNTGTATLNIATVVLGGTNSADFSIVSGTGTTCVAGAAIGFTAPANTCTIAVTFTPANANPFSATVTITDDASPTTQVVNLSGTGVTPPTATPSPTSLTFGNQPTTTTSTAQSVTLTNSGGAPLSVTSITFTGANAGDFAFASPATTCPTTASGTVAAGSSCVLSVTFAPTATGARSASISIVVTGISNPAPITLSGTGTAPDLAITKTAAGTFEAGVNGTYTIKLTNNGTAATQHQITVTDTLPAGLGFVSGTGTGWTCNAAGQTVTCTSTASIAVSASSTITLTVSVASAAVPSVKNTATVADTGDSGTNDKSSSATTTVTAPDVTISLTQPAGDFMVGVNSVYTFKVTNGGTGPTNGNIVVADTLPAGLTFVSGTGTGWACAAGAQNAQAITCTYTGAALAAAGGNSTFTMTVAVAPTAFPSVTNLATVSDPNDSKTTDKSTPSLVANVDNAVPTEISFSPSAGLIIGSGLTAQQITLTGTGFNSSTQVTIGSNTPLTGTANASGTSLTLLVPAGNLMTAGSVTISVNNPKNPTTNAGGGAAPTTQSFPLVGVNAAQDASTPGTIAVTAGTPATVKINFTTNPASSPLPGSLTVTCALPPALTGATCAVGTPTIAAGATSGSSTITINAIPTGNSGSSGAAPWSGGRGPWSTYLLCLIAMVALGMLGMLGTVRHRMLPLRRAPAYLALVLLVLAAGALVGCTTTKSGPTPTPVGPSTMAVTATAADGATVSTTVNINIVN